MKATSRRILKKHLLYCTILVSCTLFFVLSLFFKNLVNANEILIFVLITPMGLKDLQDRTFIARGKYFLS